MPPDAPTEMDLGKKIADKIVPLMAGITDKGYVEKCVRKRLPMCAYTVGGMLFHTCNVSSVGLRYSRVMICRTCVSTGTMFI